MIQLHHATLAFGGRLILNDVSWTIPPNERIGLIGPNGTGKSTLLRVIAGRQPLDEGDVAVAGSTTVGYLEQDVQETPSDRSVREEARRAFAEVLALQDEEHRIMHALETDDDHESAAYHQLLHDLQDVHDRLIALEAHRIDDRTEAVLTGLGFDPDDLDRPLHTFSGGWRMRVALARLLLRRPDYLLLDEPTNHLDIDSIDWLEQYLKAYPGTVVIVSHDWYFLDRMITTTAELVQANLTPYAGNYTFYLKERTLRRELQQAAYENQQKQIADAERFIDRFRAKATKARQVQSRIKMLDKLERIAPPPNEQASVSFRFPEPRPSGRTVFSLSAFSKTYETPEGSLCVFDDTGPLAIERGDKIALVGKNGAGKSTLARLIHGTEPFEGTRELGYNVDMAFFAQHQADSLDPGNTVLGALRERSRGHSETELRSLLGAFLFTGDDVFKPVAVLSGGERSRVALARTMLVPANFLILDEPTNHLDLQSIQVLIEALRQYTGSFVVVSHDRHFLDQIVNKVWRVEDRQVRQYLGTYSEYQWQIQYGTASRMHENGDGEARPAAQMAEKARSGGPKSKEQKRREAEERRQQRDVLKNESTDVQAISPGQLRKAYEQLEGEILEHETRKEELEAALGDPTLYEDDARARETTQAYQSVKDYLESLYDRWEKIAQALTEAG